MPNRPAPASCTCIVPAYLEETYWWAYVRPGAVGLFERQWLVNLILWGHCATLREAAFDELDASNTGKILQVACVYGDFSCRLAGRIAHGGWLDIVDVLPIQLSNLRRKLSHAAYVTAYLRDSANLGFADASYDRAILFFLLHEQPAAVRRRTLSEALRVVRPGGKLVIVDYHLPRRLHPLRYLLRHALGWLEPFALDLWNHELTAWLPEHVRPGQIAQHIYFGGLYQKVVIQV